MLTGAIEQPTNECSKVDRRWTRSMHWQPPCGPSEGGSLLARIWNSLDARSERRSSWIQSVQTSSGAGRLI